MCTKQIVPAVAIHQIGSLTVDGDILLFITLLAETGLWVEFNQTDGSEVSAIAYPKTTCCWI